VCWKQFKLVSPNGKECCFPVAVPWWCCGESPTGPTGATGAAAEIEEPAEAEDAPELEECSIRFDVPGKKRAALARAIGDILACEAEYLNPPTYAYRIGDLTLERDGTLPGALPVGLLSTLAEQGFQCED
jgi:hypothetical protein